MKKVALMCDSGADITVEQAKALGIYVVRLSISIDNELYEEGTQLDHKELGKLLDEGKVAKTSQPSPGQFKMMWDEILKEYDEILYVPISRPLSGTYSVAKTLSKEYDGRVIVVDSPFATVAIVNVLKDARVLLDQGVDANEIARRIENDVKMEAYLLPFDLQTLKRGGRISPAIAALAGFLKIQVLLKLNEEGVIVQVDKVRSVSKAHNLLVEKALVDNPQDYHWSILHSSDEETAHKIQQMVQEKINIKPEIGELLAVVRAHTGNKTIGISRIKKLK